MIEDKELIIDPEFAELIPPLDPDEYDKLEKNILEDGAVLDPIITWNGIIVDGHHRYDIICKHPEANIEYTIFEKEFTNRQAALAWMCQNQLGRRNLTPAQKKYLIGKQYEAEKHSIGGQQENQNASKRSGQNDQFVSEENKSTAQIIGEEHGIGERSVRRAEEFAQGIDLAEETVPGTKQEILSGKIKPTGKEIAELLNTEDPEERSELVSKFHEDKPNIKTAPIEEKPEINEEIFEDEEDEVDKETVISHVTIDDVEQVSAGMDSSDGRADIDDVIYEMSDALDDLIFRWDICAESNPDIVKTKKFITKRQKLIENAQRYFDSFKGGN